MRPAVFVLITLRLALDADTGWSLRPDYWAYLFARLRPGAPSKPRARHWARSITPSSHDVEAPLQKDMSGQTMARFRAKPNSSRQARTRPELDFS